MAILFNEPGALGWNVNLKNPFDKALDVSTKVQGSVDKVLGRFEEQRKLNETRLAAENANKLQLKMMAGEPIDFANEDLSGLDPKVVSDMLYKQSGLNETIRHNKAGEAYKTSSLQARKDAAKLVADEKALVKTRAEELKSLAKERDDRALLIAGNVQPKDITAQIAQSSMNGKTEDLKDLFAARKLQSVTGVPSTETVLTDIDKIYNKIVKEDKKYESDVKVIDKNMNKLKTIIPPEYRDNLTADKDTSLVNLRKYASDELGFSLKPNDKFFGVPNELPIIQDPKILAKAILSKVKKRAKSKAKKERRKVNHKELRQIDKTKKYLDLLTTKDLSDPSVVADLARMFQKKN
jgi:hypothetical protein